MTRPPFSVTAVPDTVLRDPRIRPLAFRLLVLLHAETTPPTADEADLADTLGCDRQELLDALRELDAASYLVRRYDSDWQVVPWA